jgi:uncharacterized damage-inducible protein DinB
MEQFFVDYLDRLRVMHAEIKQALAGLPPEALDWSPGPEMNSIAVLVAHSMGAERFWLGDMALGQSSDRVRAREFEVSKLTGPDLQNVLDETFAFVKGAVAGMSLAGLADLCESPNHDEPFTVGWCLLHALEHTAVHTGHIQLMRQLWQQR